MALTAAGLLRGQHSTPAVRWLLAHPLPGGRDRDANSDSNFCAYIAAGVWHHVLVTGDESFAAEMWPVVHKAIDFVIDVQVGDGEIGWARSQAGLLPRRPC